MFRKVTRFPGLMMPVLIIAFLCLLSGCGTGGLTDAPAGSSTGGATGGTTGGTTGQGVITFAVVKSSDPSTSTTSISQDSPAIVKATAIDSTGAAIAGKVMSFSSTFDIQLSPVSGTTLTDSNGTASITIMAGSTAGAATITASIKDNAGTAITNDVGIIVGLPNFSLSALTISPLTLSAGGTASVSVTVLDGSGNPYASAVPVSFTSRGVLQQPTPTASITSQVYTVKGVATATYKAIGYVGDDTVTATLSGTTFAKTGTITVNAASAGSISFISATPANIALKGTGGTGRSETSVVVFKVLDTDGKSIRKTVNFSLIANTTIGGLSLTAASADSDPGTGLVQTIVQAGTASTPVRVSATIDGTTPAIATTSDQLVISTGIPDQNSFSIAAAPLNIEGWDLDGITSDITVKLADHYNNPAPNGTAVYFRSSGGSVQPSCMTTDGTCKATFTSQAPREKVINPGRVVILAYALGEESFVDLNGNGIYDTTIPDTFTDMWEPFLDANEDGLKGASEEFVDTNADGLYNKDGVFNGILRDAAITGSTTIHVRNSVTVVLSGSAADITLRNILGNPIVTAALSTCVDAVPFVNTPVEFKVNIVDVNGNVMPAGTKIEFSTSHGNIINKPVSWTMPSTSAQTNGTFTYTVIMESDATQLTAAPFTCTNAKKDGRLIVQVTTPKGLLTAQSFSVTD